MSSSRSRNCLAGLLLIAAWQPLLSLPDSDLMHILKALKGDPKTLKGWNDTTPCPLKCNGIYPMPSCTWEGIFCIGGHVYQLHLKSMNLSGRLEDCFASLGRLSHLQTLDLHDNNLTGRIPRLHKTKVAKLFLQNNRFSGPIPKHFGNTSKSFNWSVNWLDLSSNQLTGKIPSGLGNIGSLQVLNLVDNQLTGAIPEDLGLSASLNTLQLSYNKLSGSIPNTFGHDWETSTNWQDWVTFDCNKLTGTIPANMTKLPLINLNLTNNNLSGTIPDGFCNGGWSNILLAGNQFNGTLPPCLGRSPFGFNPMMNFDVSGNNLTGPLPKGIANFTGAMWFAVHNNRLSGPIPPGIQNMTNVQYLNLGNNDFTGKLPLNASSLSASLQFLIVSNNSRLSGNLPNLTNYTQLEYLDVSFTDLSGSFPQVPKACCVRYRCTHFTGHCPKYHTDNCPKPVESNICPKPDEFHIIV